MIEQKHLFSQTADGHTNFSFGPGKLHLEQFRVHQSLVRLLFGFLLQQRDVNHPELPQPGPKRHEVNHE